jgi:nucleoside-diphosphate-sugar epimerase/FAD/FMN-containing dehydrogenase
VTGGSGGIGGALLEQLVDLYEVKALFRTKNELSDKWQHRGCTAVWGDLTHEQALSELVTGAKFVFHCAAMTQGSYRDADTVNVEGTRRLARLAATHKCHRFVHVSSVAVYSAAPSGSDYVEDTELREHEGMAVYALTKLQAEQALREVAQEHGLEYTILRPTSVYGPNTKPYTLVPVDLIRKGLPVILGDGHGLLDVVFVDDVVRVLLLAAASARANGEVFNIGHEPVTFNDFFAHYSRMMNRPARRLPLSFITAASQLMERVPGARKTHFTELAKGARFLAMMARNTKPFPSSKARTVLGYAPAFSLAAGMLKTELWLKQNSLVSATRYSFEGYGPLPFRPLAVVHPVTEDELVQTTRTALNSGVKLRAIGSLHSPSPIPYTDGICVVLDKYNKVLKVDGPLVTVQGGITLRDLNETLAGLNLALSTNGSITAQTVSGAVSTATHGGSIFHASLSDYVEAVRIVRADGGIIEIDRSQDLLHAVIVSLGLLGIISTVTFRCVPSFALRATSSVRKAQDVLDDFDQMNRRSLFTCMFYFPVTDEMEILSVDRVEDAEIDALEREPRDAARKKRSLVNTNAGQRLARLGLKGFAWLLRRDPSIQRFFTRFSVGSSYPTRTARSDRVLAMSDVGSSGRSPMMLQDMEIAIPYEHAQTAISVLRKHFLTTRTSPLIPIHIRCSARSKLWLSPAYERDVCWLEFWQYPSSDTLFNRVHELLEPFGYRFHWGKEARADREYIRQQYPRWNDFVRLREAWDPNGLFLNDYLQSFFCTKEPTGPVPTES